MYDYGKCAYRCSRRRHRLYLLARNVRWKLFGLIFAQFCTNIVSVHSNIPPLMPWYWCVCVHADLSRQRHAKRVESLACLLVSD